MPPAIIAGGIAAAGAIGGAVLSSSAQKKAAKQANAAQQDATQAQLTLGRESLALNKDIYGQNKAMLTPFVNRGNVAGDSINALLGLPSAPTAAPAPAAGAATGGASTPASWAEGAIAAMAPNITRSSTWNAANAISDPEAKLQYLLSQSPAYSDQMPLYNAYAAANPRPGSAQTNPVAAQEPLGGISEAGAVPASGVTPISAMGALNNFSNSAGMQFQLDQGADMINNRMAGGGTLQSGAAMKALQDHGQQTALNNYFMPYMGLLSGQQSVGAQAGSAVAGVGTNFGNTAANINAGMGANIQQGANSASNAALLRGQATSNMWSGIGGALGGFASSFG